MILSQEKLNEIKEESIRHSNTLTDWTIEALIKEFLWAIYNSYGKPECTERELKAHDELISRISCLEDKTDYEKEVIRSHLFNLMLEQTRCGKSSCVSHKIRNQALRQFEKDMGIVPPSKSPISDTFLP